MRGIARLMGLAPVWLAAMAGGCTDARERLVAPRALIAPAYEGGEPIIAVAPPSNESGTTLADPLLVADQLAGQIERVQGLRAMPLNRTLAAMSALDMEAVSSPEDAHRLLEALDADALVVGTITAYDPYNPPKFGLSLALFTAPGRLDPGQRGPTPEERHAAALVDPVTLQTAPVEVGVSMAIWADRPASVASANLDSADQGVQLAVKDYAEGRSETVSALGWRRYLASMRLFTDFACYHLTERLLEAESRRVGPATVASQAKGSKPGE